MSVALGASLASRGLLSVEADPRSGAERLRQTSWRQMLRAPATRPAWALKLPGGGLFPPSDPLREVRFV